MKKNRLLIEILAVSFACIIFIVCLFILGNNNATVVNNPVDLLLTNKPKLEDDFYDNINFDYLKENHIKEGDMIHYNAMDDDSILSEKRAIINDILAKCGTYKDNSIDNKMCILYDKYINNYNEELMKKELSYYVDMINNSSNMNDLFNNILNINKKLSLDILINPVISIDPKNYKNDYFTFDLISYSFDNYFGDVYVLDNYENDVDLYKNYDIELLELFGYSEKESTAMVNDINDMYYNIAKFSIRDSKFFDKSYKVFSLNELKTKINNINLDTIIKNYKEIYDGKSNILVADIGQIQSIDDYFVEANIKTIKEYAISKIISNYLPKISLEGYKIQQKYDNRISDTSIEEKDKNQIIYDILYKNFSDYITKIFYDKNITDKEISIYTKLVEDEKEMFIKRINDSTWLTTKTKNNAVNKIDKLSYTVGIPSELAYPEKKYSYKNGDSFFNIIIDINGNIEDETNKQFSMGNILYGQIDYLAVNAFYLPQTNGIYIIPGIIYNTKLNLSLNDNNIDSYYYQILGYLGITIGHELTHALDANGSKYDEYGNKKNWWTEDDKKKFNLLCNRVIKYYNNYDEIGYQTLSENIADLGGMALIMELANKQNANNEDYKNIFESYTKVWASQTTGYGKHYFLTFDEHSLAKIRVNGVLSSIDKFYEVYNIKQNDKMYVAKENRVYVW